MPIADGMHHLFLLSSTAISHHSKMEGSVSDLLNKENAYQSHTSSYGKDVSDIKHNRSILEYPLETK